MSDSFADLWKSTAPPNPATSASSLPLSSQSSNVSGQGTPRLGIDSFAALATSRPSSRPITPGFSSLASQASQATKASGSTGSSAKSASGDAFSSLLGSQFSSTKNGPMSLAARQAQALTGEVAGANTGKKGAEGDGSMWDGLDVIGSRTSSPAVGAANARASPSIASSSHNSPSLLASGDHQPDEWDILGFAQAPPPPPTLSNSARTSDTKRTDSMLVFDLLDDFRAPPPAPPPRSSPPRDPTPPRKTTRSPFQNDTVGAFDFGDREEEAPIRDDDDDGGDGDAEDDVLGILSGRPASQVARAPSAPRQAPSRTSSNSPPPHIIGQLVEMGFSPQQARVALAATDSGLDVAQALEILLASSTGGDAPQNGGPRPRPRPAPAARSRSFAEDDTHPPAPRPPTRARAPAVPDRSDGPARPSSQSPALLPADLQERTDKLLAQASGLGLSVFSRANALWKEGREKVQKAYEERAASASALGTGAGAGARAREAPSGRPKWMAENVEYADGETPVRELFRENDGRGFVDDEGDGRAEDRAATPAVDASSSQQRPEPHPRPPAEVANLFGDEPAVYVSPSRRRGGPSRAAVAAPAPAPKSTTPPVLPPARPTALRRRSCVSASPSVISASSTHKAKGAEFFKLGRYAEAESAYSRALSALPSNHLLSLPLFNNRALTRIKTGDSSGAIEDATAVISIVGVEYHPAREAKVEREDEGSAVNLADMLVKAYRRRAEAFEAKEKWELARKDWDAIVACDWAGQMRKDALNGSRRCQQTVSAEQAPAPRKPAARPAARKPAHPQTSEAVKRLRAANKAQEEEDQARHELKDAVDARLVAWKGGKEANLRALLSSLETVLWPELGWKKVSMAEVISPAQVKVRYTKAIAKLHPDKLNVNNTTLEQRMIANGVFSALNDAWVAFKQ